MQNRRKPPRRYTTASETSSCRHPVTTSCPSCTLSTPYSRTQKDFTLACLKRMPPHGCHLSIEPCPMKPVEPNSKRYGTRGRTLPCFVMTSGRKWGNASSRRETLDPCLPDHLRHLVPVWLQEFPGRCVIEGRTIFKNVTRGCIVLAHRRCLCGSISYILPLRKLELLFCQHHSEEKCNRSWTSCRVISTMN